MFKWATNGQPRGRTIRRGPLVVAGAGNGGFPAVQTRANTTSTSTETNTYVVTMPSGLTVGDLILVCVSVDGNPTLTIDTTASGSNWNSLGTVANGTNISAAAYWKIASGGDALELDLSASEKFSARAWRISGASGVSMSSTTTSGANPAQPPAHTPAGGSKKYRWISFGAHNAGWTTTSYPTGWVDTFEFIGLGGGNSDQAHMTSCEKEAEATSQTPGTYTTNVAENWVFLTLAVAP